MVPWGAFPWKPTLPATIGNEGAGIVLALGKGVTSVAGGDRVVLPPLLDNLKTYQQRLIVPAAELVVIPRDADPQQASLLAFNPVSAELLLNEYVDLKSGDAVVFNSATSGLSQWLIALAKERGIGTIGLVRKAADVETVKQRGCDVVIVDDEPLDEAAKKLEGLNIPLGLDVQQAGCSSSLLSGWQARSLRGRHSEAFREVGKPLKCRSVAVISSEYKRGANLIKKGEKPP
jgi:NADPH:quinone reductase-like Zn-dependent oxidoreductase